MTRRFRASARPLGSRRGVAALAGALLAPSLGGGFTPSAAAAGPAVPASQALVVLHEDRVARVGPDFRARRIESLSARRPLTRTPTVVPVLGQARSRGGNLWLRVRLPGRPNGHAGWIRAARTRRTSTEWHLVLDLSARRVTAHRDGRAVRRFRAVVGTRSTPTPRGRFFIEEAVAVAAGHPGGPFALATSARSQVLQEFAGGPGQIALHGTRGLSGALGSASSHGCIRLSTPAIAWLAQRIGGGVPLTVTG